MQLITIFLNPIALIVSLWIISTPIVASTIGPASNEVKEIQQLANLGDTSAQYKLAALYDFGVGDGIQQDDTKALIWYEKAANQGNTKSQFKMGQFHSEGRGVEQNHIKAIYWYERAASKNHLLSLLKLAIIYQDGLHDIEQDHSKALILFKNVANQGFINAQYTVGQYYEEGLGTKANKHTAKKWYQLACNNHLEQACQKSFELELEGY